MDQWIKINFFKPDKINEVRRELNFQIDFNFKEYIMEHQILRLTDVIAMTGLSRSTIYLRMVQGKFPNKINLGSRAVGWISSEVNEWIEERIRESRLVEAIN